MVKWVLCELGASVGASQSWARVVGCAPVHGVHAKCKARCACLTAAHSHASWCVLYLQVDTGDRPSDSSSTRDDAGRRQRGAHRGAGEGQAWQQQQPSAAAPCCRSHNRGTPADLWLAVSLCDVVVLLPPPPADLLAGLCVRQGALGALPAQVKIKCVGYQHASRCRDSSSSSSGSLLPDLNEVAKDGWCPQLKLQWWCTAGVSGVSGAFRL